MSTPNPFRPPTELEGSESLDEVVRTKGTAETVVMPARKFLLRWALVVCLNAAVPMMFATAVVDSAAHWVVVSGLVLVFLSGALICLQFAWLRRRILAGSYVVGVSQLFPIVHMIAGAIALQISETIGFAGGFDDVGTQNMTNPLAIFLVIFITAAVLALVALAIGSVLILLIDQLRVRRLRVVADE